MTFAITSISCPLQQWDSPFFGAYSLRERYVLGITLEAACESLVCIDEKANQRMVIFIASGITERTLFCFSAGIRYVE